MSDLGSRLRRLEKKLIEVLSADEYLDADNRQRARAWKAIAEEPQRFPGFLCKRVFTDWVRRILLNDTPEQREGPADHRDMAKGSRIGSGNGS